MIISDPETRNPKPETPRRPVRAVVWDFDGTLVDSPVAVQAATNAALAEHGFAAATLEQVKTGMLRPTVPRMAWHAGIEADAALAQTLNDAFYRHAAELFPQTAHPFPGMAELVEGLAVPQAVVTNNLGSMVRATLGRCGLLLRMRAVLGDGDLPAAKPDARGPWMAAAACGVDPADCAYIGDSAVDLETARAAGMTAIGVTWGTTPRARMIGFDALYDAPSELAQLGAG